MAFPATYNISYYRGDTYDFIINPKNSNGTAFDLTGYSSLFTIASSRGDAEAFVASASATVNSSAATVTCKIPSHLGPVLSGASYVYDVEIRNSASTTYTLLTGTITVTQDVARTGE